MKFIDFSDCWWHKSFDKECHRVIRWWWSSFPTANDINLLIRSVIALSNGSDSPPPPPPPPPNSSKTLLSWVRLLSQITWSSHLDLWILYLIADCDGYHAWGRRCLLNPEHLVVLLAGPISHTSTQYIDFADFFIFHWICLPSILLILVGVKLPLCVLSLYPRMLCYVFWSQVEYGIVYFIYSWNHETKKWNKSYFFNASMILGSIPINVTLSST